MRYLFEPRLVNDAFGDPALYVDFRDERRALLFDLGDISVLPPRKLMRLSHVFVTHTHMDHFAGFSARFISGVAIYHCVGARDARRDRALEARFSSGGADTVRSLRIDPHEATGGCWFHADTFCLSTSEAVSS